MGLTALTRPNGILILIPLLLQAVMRKGEAREIPRRLAPIAMVPLAFISYCLYVYSLTGDPLGWLAAQRWHYSVGGTSWGQVLSLLTTIERHGLYDFFFTSNLAAYQLVHGVIALGALSLTPVVFARFGAPLGTYTLASLLVPLSGSDLQGMGRYIGVLFPLFMVLGSWRSPLLHESLLIVSALFLALAHNRGGVITEELVRRSVVARARPFWRRRRQHRTSGSRRCQILPDLTPSPARRTSAASLVMRSGSAHDVLDRLETAAGTGILTRTRSRSRSVGLAVIAEWTALHVRRGIVRKQ